MSTVAAVMSYPSVLRRAIPWIASLVALSLAYMRWIDPNHWNVVDLIDFVQGGSSVVSGDDVYRHIAGVEPFNYPPFAAVVFVPIAWVGPDAAKWVASCVSLLCALVAVALSVRETALTRYRRAGWVTCLAFLVFAMEPTDRTFIYGQINLLLMALVMGDLLIVPARFRGVLIGMAAGIKLVPAIFVFYFLLRGERRAAARVGLTGLLTVVLGWVAAPASSARYWLGDLDKVSRFGDVADDAGNQSLWAMVMRFGVPGDTAVLATVGVLGIGVSVWVVRRALAAERRLEAVCCLAIGGLLASPISWTHHWVWVLPVLVVMGKRRWLGMAGVTVLIMFLPPMWFVPNDPGTGYSPGQALVASSYTVAALIFLGVLARALDQELETPGAP